jgi:hypothetical protein
MSRITINQIIARYAAGFGYVAANAVVMGFKPWENVNIPIYKSDDSNFANVTFKNQKSGNTYSFGLPFGYSSEYMAPPIMVTFSREKNVVRTPIDRSEVEVIEYFGLKPYDIKIQGIVIDNEEHLYPQTLSRKISEMFAESGTFQVSGDLFADEGITEIFFVGGFEKSFVEGYADTIKFSISAISTMPVEVRVTNNKS